MGSIRKHFDVGSLLAIFVTLVLFEAALFLKGFSHDPLLEAGVFLVSVKLIIMAYKDDVATRDLSERLGRLQLMLTRPEAHVDPRRASEHMPSPAGREAV